MAGLRVEEKPLVPVVAPTAPPVMNLEYWRRLAIQNGERLQQAESQLKDLRASTDEMRARLNKAKDRQESAQARVNELQATLTIVSVENESLKLRLAPLEDIRRKTWDLLEDAQAKLLETTT